MAKFSIITVNLNNASDLQRTMDSIYQQTYTDYEYIVMDGGSTDGSKELIEKNADKLNYWISEKDNGVYHAMNKGIENAKGDYLLFLNSGDYLIHEKILHEVIHELDGTGIVYGNIFFIMSDSKSWTGVYPGTLSFQHFVEGSLPHPSSFIKRTVFEKVGLYDESLKIVADWKFFLNAICSHNVSYKHIDKTISVFYHDGLSSIAENRQIIANEKRSVFLSEYPMFIENSNELTNLRAFKNNPAISKFVKAAKLLGLLRSV